VRGGSASEVPPPQDGGVSPSNSKVKGSPPPHIEEERVEKEWPQKDRGRCL